jgi:hypothetical protein
MIGWMASWVWWISWRLAASLACLWTIQNVIHQEGYFIEYRTLLVAGICIIVGVRIWMPATTQTSR